MRAKSFTMEEFLERFHPRDFYSRPLSQGEFGWPNPEMKMGNPLARYEALPEHNEWTERMLQNEFYWKRKRIFDPLPYTKGRMYSSSKPPGITVAGSEKLTFPSVTSAVGASAANTLTLKRTFSSLLMSPLTTPSSAASSSSTRSQSQKQSLQPEDIYNTNDDDNIRHPPMFLHESPPEESAHNETEPLSVSNEDRQADSGSDDFAPEADARNFADEPEPDLPPGQDPRMWHAEGPRQSSGFRIRSLIKHLFDASPEHHREQDSSSNIQGRTAQTRKLKDMNVMTNEDDITKP